MFSRLNQLISKLGEEPKGQESGTGGAYGFQVLRNKNADFALEPWFDFIIGVNGRTIVCHDRNLDLVYATNVDAGQSGPSSVHNRNPQLCRHKCQSRGLVSKRTAHSRGLCQYHTRCPKSRNQSAMDAIICYRGCVAYSRGHAQFAC